jgi:alkylhydroperoxidase/carboxymuconolactone decarboxylase family protein YurZ
MGRQGLAGDMARSMSVSDVRQRAGRSPPAGGPSFDLLASKVRRPPMRPGSQDRGLAASGASVALGSPAVCLEWSTGRPLAAGASEDEIADVLLAIAPVAGLGRIVAAAPDVATALGYDIAAALEEPDDH